jgi:hypothetical protein
MVELKRRGGPDDVIERLQRITSLLADAVTIREENSSVV